MNDEDKIMSPVRLSEKWLLTIAEASQYYGIS